MSFRWGQNQLTRGEKMIPHDCRESEDDFGESKSHVTEQSPPRASEGDVWLLVLKDMEERRRHGIEKYGVPVQPFNGRDSLVDAYQEALDLCVYLRQTIEERERRQGVSDG